MTDKLTVIEKIGGFVSTILLGKTKEIIIRTDEKVNGLIKSTDELKQDFNSLRDSIQTCGLDIKALQVHTKYGISNSPTVPSPEGKKLLADSGFLNQYPNIKDKLFSLMDEMKLRTLYDYEVGAFNALKAMQNDPAIDPLKDYAVNNPDETLDLIFKVASWVIRDDYAKKLK